MGRALSILVGATWLLATMPAMPHHSFAAEFDINRPIDITGTVTRIDWTNPHAWIHVDVQSDDGSVQNWSVELLGINTLYRRGWTRDKVKPGDVLTIAGFGARDGTNTGNASAITMTNTGEQLWDSASLQ